VAHDTQEGFGGLWTSRGGEEPSHDDAYSGRMRFERIFDDLEGQFAHQQQQEVRAVSEDLTRAEQAQLTLADRLRGAAGHALTLHLGTALRVGGTVQDVGTEWVSLAVEGGGRRAVVPLCAVALVEGLPTRARPAEETLRSALGLGSVLREIARDRSVVRLETTAGGLIGRIAAVGADALDLRTLPTGEPTAAPGSARLTVTTSSLLAVLPR
jgi:hypothetical protein